MLRDGGKAHLERLGQFGDRDFAGSQAARIARGESGSAKAAKVVLRSGVIIILVSTVLYRGTEPFS